MKKLFAILLALFLTSCSEPEPDAPKGIFLHSQAEVDAFAASGREINSFSAAQDVFIGSESASKPSDITNISGLYNIHYALNLSIRNNPGLTSLQGLQNLKMVNNITITENDALTDITALHSLTRVDYEITVSFNKKLPNLKGLEGITSAAALKVGYNDSLVSLEGVNNLEGVYFALIVAKNPLLASLDGLDKLTGKVDQVYIGGKNLTGIEKLKQLEFKYLSIDESVFTDLSAFDNLVSLEFLKIIDNPYLQSLNGLNLESLGECIIENNNNLTSISSFNTLHSVKRMNIRSNDALTSLDGLQNITAVEYSLSIIQNAALRNFCALQSVVNANVDASFIGIYDNYYNPTVQDIREQHCSIE